MAAVRSEGELFVVYGEDDEGHTYLVSLDEPSAAGAKRTDYAAKLHLLVIPRRWRASREPRSRDLVRATVALSVPITFIVTLALLATVGAPAAGLALIGIPAMIILGHRAHKAWVARNWPDRHRLLHEPSEVNLFARGFRAARRVLTLWPEMHGLIDEDVPCREITESLWTLAQLLDQREALRAALPDVDLARHVLPVQAIAERDGLNDRHRQIVASLARQRADIDHRIAWLESLATECDEFVRFERAVSGAREVMARADQLLGPTSQLALAMSDPVQDLAERIRFTVAEYRNLPRPYQD